MDNFSINNDGASGLYSNKHTELHLIDISWVDADEENRVYSSQSPYSSHI